jgi:hypothetical protein
MVQYVKGETMRTRAVTNGQVTSMELTKDQAYLFLRKELITGLEDGELTEEEFVIQMKILRRVVEENVFTLSSRTVLEVARANGAF